MIATGPVLNQRYYTRLSGTRIYRVQLYRFLTELERFGTGAWHKFDCIVIRSSGAHVVANSHGLYEKREDVP